MGGDSVHEPFGVESLFFARERAGVSRGHSSRPHGPFGNLSCEGDGQSGVSSRGHRGHRAAVLLFVPRTGGGRADMAAYGRAAFSGHGGHCRRRHHAFHHHHEHARERRHARRAVYSVAFSASVGVRLGDDMRHVRSGRVHGHVRDINGSLGRLRYRDDLDIVGAVRFRGKRLRERIGMANEEKAKEPAIGGIIDRVAPWALALGALLATLGFVLNFTIAPLVNGAAVNEPALIGGVMVQNKLLLSQKIFYWHMPVAIASFGALVFTAYYGIRFLMTKRACYDTRARIATEIALVFVLCTMASGEMWERFEWGVWWTWEPRLTTYFILMLMIFGYFILRNAVEDTERRAVYASVFGILIFIDVPICFLVTRLIPSGVHPVIFRTDSGLSPEMLLPLMLGMAGFALIAFGLYRLRLRAQVMEEKLARIQDKLED